MTATLRADARRNRELLLAAAREEYAASGSRIAMQDVARRAGLGVGTLYRHFSTRDELIDAIARPFFDEMLLLARAAHDGEEGATAFDRFVRGFAEAHADHGVAGHCMWDAPAAASVRDALRAALADLVARGIAAGALRPDLTREDASIMLWSIARLVDASRAAGPQVWRRYVELLLDGVRTSLPQPLPAGPVPPAAWDAVVRDSSSAPAAR